MMTAPTPSLNANRNEVERFFRRIAIPNDKSDSIFLALTVRFPQLP